MYNISFFDSEQEKKNTGVDCNGVVSLVPSSGKPEIIVTAEPTNGDQVPNQPTAGQANAGQVSPCPFDNDITSI